MKFFNFTFNSIFHATEWLLKVIAILSVLFAFKFSLKLFDLYVEVIYPSSVNILSCGGSASNNSCISFGFLSYKVFGYLPPPFPVFGFVFIGILVVIILMPQIKFQTKVVRIIIALSVIGLAINCIVYIKGELCLYCWCYHFFLLLSSCLIHFLHQRKIFFINHNSYKWQNSLAICVSVSIIIFICAIVNYRYCKKKEDYQKKINNFVFEKYPGELVGVLIKSSSKVTSGKGKCLVFLISDPLCPFCKLQFEDLHDICLRFPKEFTLIYLPMPMQINSLSKEIIMNNDSFKLITKQNIDGLSNESNSDFSQPIDCNELYIKLFDLDKEIRSVIGDYPVPIVLFGQKMAVGRFPPEILQKELLSYAFENN